ncbi:MAG: hypothetical protein ACJ8OJ_17435, partial [Povalibacter sp.]
ESRQAGSQPSPEDADMSEIAVTGMRKAVAPQRSGPRNTVNADATSAEALSEDKTAERFATPEDWLKHIRDLRGEGRSADADSEWQDFRKRYPDYFVAESDVARGTARH